MDIKRAKQEIKDSIEAYLLKDGDGGYKIPSIRQRPILLMGPPGIGKTQIMEQIAKECKIGLVAYTITHHTRQSAVGLPFIREKMYGGRESKRGFCSSMRSTVSPRRLRLRCLSSFNVRPLAIRQSLRGGLSLRPAIRRSITNLCGILIS